MATQLFINLAVKDVKKTMDFFSKLGFTFNMQFTNENAACMIINDEAFVMLLRESFFKTFIKKELVDAYKGTEVITSISAESKDKVNKIVDKALSIGATETREPLEQGFMFGRSFSDPDGHIWEVFWMDMNAFTKEQ